MLLKGVSILAFVYYKVVYIRGVLRHRRRPAQLSGVERSGEERSGAAILIFNEDVYLVNSPFI